jgi:hypothetical protein
MSPSSRAICAGNIAVDVQAAETDLSIEDDEVLDASLTQLYAEHLDASDAHDLAVCAEIHYCIVRILAEQSRRLDAWILEHVG